MKTKSRFFGFVELCIIKSIIAVDKKLKHLRHFVCFKYKNNISEETITKIDRAFVKLEKRIDDINGFEKGLNNSPEGLNKGFKQCYLITFDSEEGRDRYLFHPDHKKFVELVGPVLEDVFVVDYWAAK